jgi:hypothetical protein
VSWGGRTASAAATRVERRNCALRSVRFALSTVALAQPLGAAAIIGCLGLGPFAACTVRGHSIGTDHGQQDRRDEDLRAQLPHPDRPLSHGWPQPTPSVRPFSAAAGRYDRGARQDGEHAPLKK